MNFAKPTQHIVRSVDLPVWTSRITWLIVLVTGLRLLAATFVGLTDTEAYYASWSRVIDWSYYDHPPLVAWSVALTKHIATGTLGLRLGPVIAGAIFLVLFSRFVARLFSPRAAFYATALLLSMPVFLFIGFVLNPEAMLAPLWMLSFSLLWDMRDRDERWRPLALGAAIGAAFLAKYTAVLVVPIAAIWLASSPRTRRWLRRPELYAGGLLALAIASPVIAWNAFHGWPSLHLHLQERMAAPSMMTFAENALSTLLGQIGLFQPFALVLLVFVIARAWKHRDDDRHRLLGIASAGVLAFFFFMMVRVRDAEPHWTLSGWMPAAILAGAWIDERATRTKHLGASITIGASMTFLLSLHAVRPFLPIPAHKDPTNESVGWDLARETIASDASKLGAVVAASHNSFCGRLAIELGDVYCASPRRTEFDFMDRRDPGNVPILFVESDRYPSQLPDRACTLYDSFEIKRRNATVNRFRLYSCT